MKAPWKFRCKNLHIQFKAELSIEHQQSVLAQTLRFLPGDAIIENIMLLTICRMHSTCFRENDFIASNEAILKLAVTLRSARYYLPVFAVVDAPHSIVRGALLGYTKNISSIATNDSQSEFEWNNVINSIKFTALDNETDDILLLPHLTYRNYRTSDFEIRGLSALDVSDYTTSKMVRCTLTEVNLPFLNSIGISPITPYIAGKASDSFTINGSRYV